MVRLSFRSTPPLFQVWRNDSTWWPLIRLHVPFEFFRAFFFLFRSSSWALGSLFSDSKGALLSAFASSAARDFLVLVPPQGVP